MASAHSDIPQIRPRPRLVSDNGVLSHGIAAPGTPASLPKIDARRDDLPRMRGTAIQTPIEE